MTVAAGRDRGPGPGHGAPWTTHAAGLRRPTRRSCGPTAAWRPTAGRRSSCCWTGSSRGRWCFALNRAEQCLDEPRGQRPAGRLPERGQRLLGRTRADLEYRSLSDVVADLPGEMERLQRTCALGHRRGHPALLRRRGDELAGRLAGRCRTGWDRCSCRIVHTTRFEYDGKARRVVQPGADDPADHARPDRRAQPARGVARPPWTYDVPRLLRQRGHRLRGARPARVDDGHRDVDGADRAGRPPPARPRRGRSWPTPGGGRPVDRVPRARRPGRPARRPRGSCAAAIAAERRAARARRPAQVCDAGPPARSSTSPARPTSHTTAGRRVGSSAPACARTWRTWSSAGCGRSASRPATSPATCTRSAEPVVGETVVGESHAWVEWWDDGWHAFDPTNDRRARRPVGRGRHRPRLRRREARCTGIFSGAGTSAMTVEVDVTRLA